MPEQNPSESDPAPSAPLTKSALSGATVATPPGNTSGPAALTAATAATAATAEELGEVTMTKVVASGRLNQHFLALLTWGPPCQEYPEFQMMPSIATAWECLFPRTDAEEGAQCAATDVSSKDTSRRAMRQKEKADSKAVQ